MPDDFSELAKLAADLTHAPEAAVRNVKKSIQVTATEIKEDWRQGAERTGLTGYAAAIDYDLNFPGGAIEAEIGPSLDRPQGPLGLVEDANGRVRSAPQHAGRDAMEANEPDFYRGLEIAIFDATTEAVEK